MDDAERRPSAPCRLGRDGVCEPLRLGDAGSVEVERDLTAVVVKAGHSVAGGGEGKATARRAPRGTSAAGNPGRYDAFKAPFLDAHPAALSPFLTTAKTLAVTTGKETMDDDVPSLAAAIAYYTVFSLPPLLVVVVAVAGAVFGPEAVREALTGQVGSMIGADAAGAIDGMIASAGDLGSGVGSKLAGLAALLFGATGAFGQLQKSMNRAWDVEDKASGGIVATVLKRLVSFGMILTIAFLLLVSLAVSAVVAALGEAASSVAPSGIAEFGMQVANLVVSLGVITVLFAAMFKWLPDTEIAWRNVWVGAFATSVLFTLGKTGIGIYLGRSDPGSAFGAAGSLALILVWIYYSALILLVGVEFTQAWTQRKMAAPPSGGTSEAGPPDASGERPGRRAARRSRSRTRRRAARHRAGHASRRSQTGGSGA